MGEIFERVMPATALEWTGERLTTATAGQVEIEHLHRYFLARNLCRGLDVLDVAAGEGYGAALLAQVARSVIGVEISAEAVSHASEAYRTSNLRYLAGDARQLPLKDASVDVVVSFETIEHFYEQDQFMSEVRRVLRADGYFVVSSPERDVYSPSGSSANPYHVRELTRAEFLALLQSFFAQVQLMGQRPILGSAIVSEGNASGHALTFEKRGPRHYEASTGLPRPVYFFAVASNRPIANAPDSLYIETAEIGAVIQELPELRRQTDEHIQRLQAANLTSLDQTTRANALDVALAEARAEVASACSQRDLARAAARRAAASAEGAWHNRVVDLEQQVEQWHNRVVDLEQQVEQWHNQVAELEQQVEQWRRRYQGLRGRLEAILVRFWVIRASRLLPAPMRRFVRERMLGPAR